MRCSISLMLLLKANKFKFRCHVHILGIVIGINIYWSYMCWLKIYMLKKISHCLELIVKKGETKLYMSYSFCLQNVLVENTLAFKLFFFFSLSYTLVLECFKMYLIFPLEGVDVLGVGECFRVIYVL